MEYLDGKIVREDFLNRLKEKLEKENMGQLAVIQVGNDMASTRYIKQKEKLAKELGIPFVLWHLDETTGTKEICDTIEFLNEDDHVEGIILQLPLPKENEYDYEKIRNTIDPNKDVDGVNDVNILRLVNGNPKAMIPCTALGIMKILDFYGIDPKGKDITIIGRSIHIGKALYQLLLQKDATVTICHSKTKDIPKHTKDSDIVITSVGKADFLKQDMIRPDATVIDVGFNYKNGKLCGDAEEGLTCKYLTPVPGGVGQMTVYAIFENLLKAHYLLQEKEIKKTYQK